MQVCEIDDTTLEEAVRLKGESFCTALFERVDKHITCGIDPLFFNQSVAEAANCTCDDSCLITDPGVEMDNITRTWLILLVAMLLWEVKTSVLNIYRRFSFKKPTSHAEASEPLIRSRSRSRVRRSDNH
jgi:hypothetical protein